MGDQCSKHDDLIKDFVEIKTDLKWLKKDRVEQKEAYYKKKNWRLRFYLYSITLISGVLSYAFVHREEARLIIKEWLLK